MILNISIENYRSYNTEQEISFVADERFVNDKKENLYFIEDYNIYVNKILVLYGSNGSGKSNFLKGLECFYILLSNDLDRLEKRVTFLSFFDSEEPTKIKIEFLHSDNFIYSYLISFTKTKIFQERLIKYTLEKEEIIIFERLFNEQEDNYYFHDYSLLLSEEQLSFAENIIKMWTLTTTKQRLFLYQAIQNNCVKLEPILNQLKLMLIRDCDYASPVNSLQDRSDLVKAMIQYEKSQTHSLASDMLNKIGATLNDLRIENLESEASLKSIYSYLDKEIKYDFITVESAGTQKFYSYFAIIHHAISKGRALFIDEFESHLHWKVLNELLKLVLKSNSKAQLLFTTHNTYLLNSKILFPDQIIFANKTENANTEIYALSDFEDIPFDKLDYIDIEKEYLSNKFYAIPPLQEGDICEMYNSGFKTKFDLGL